MIILIFASLYDSTLYLSEDGRIASERRIRVVDLLPNDPQMDTLLLPSHQRSSS